MLKGFPIQTEKPRRVFSTDGKSMAKFYRYFLYNDFQGFYPRFVVWEFSLTFYLALKTNMY